MEGGGPLHRRECAGGAKNREDRDFGGASAPPQNKANLCEGRPFPMCPAARPSGNRLTGPLHRRECAGGARNREDRDFGGASAPPQTEPVSARVRQFPMCPAARPSGNCLTGHRGARSPPGSALGHCRPGRAPMRLITRPSRSLQGSGAGRPRCRERPPRNRRRSEARPSSAGPSRPHRPRASQGHRSPSRQASDRPH